MLKKVEWCGELLQNPETKTWDFEFDTQNTFFTFVPATFDSLLMPLKSQQVFFSCLNSGFKGLDQKKFFQPK